MRLVLDTCVLFPVATREILLNYARAGGFQPLWSNRILEEWRLAAEAKLADEDRARVSGEMALMNAAFPDALISGWEAFEIDVDLPDPNDAHVVAAGRAGAADGIITFNIRDFPQRALSPLGLSRLHPDEYLRSAFLRDSQRMEAALKPLADAAEANGASFRTFLKRANLPRLGKAWES